MLFDGGYPKRFTIVAEKELVVYSIDCERLEVLPLVDELQGSVSRVEQALSIQRLEIDNLEAIRASDTQFRFQEVY